MTVALCREPMEWDAYILAHPESTNYHRWAWKRLIEDTYGHQTYYLAAKNSLGIQGILPLVEIRSWLFGRRLVSLPFFSYGGVLANSQETREELLGKAVELARDLSAKSIELRQGSDFETAWQKSVAKVAMRVRLPNSAAELFKSLRPRLRNKIRNAEKNGFQCKWGGSDSVGAFYSIFACNMRNLGTPVYPRAWFRNFFRVAPAESRILTIWEKRTPVAATLITMFRETVELPWIASTPESRGKYSTVLLYWKALEWAVQNGYRCVDLGRCTPGSGTWSFKSQWNCHETPLTWLYWLREGESIPEFRPNNPKFDLAIKAWKRLPLGVANLIGPRIVRAIP